jgi:hypothetical protein
MFGIIEKTLIARGIALKEFLLYRFEEAVGTYRCNDEILW